MDKEWLRDKSNISALLPNNLKLQEFLDEGGQGIVYKGEVSGEKAAIKIYFPGQNQTRIEREVIALQEINCQSIVRLLWNGSAIYKNQSLPVVATELINGHSLKKIIHEKNLCDDEFGIIAFDISKAIDSLWQKRIVNRDLKPENILIKENGRACVIDLGVARHLDQSSLTAMGATWGTLGYMSPEQTRGVRQLTCKSDLFSLGVILVESALRRHPTNQDQLRLLSMQLHENLPAEISNWKHAETLQSLLNPKQVKRPKPSELIKSLKEYKSPDTK